MGLTTFRGRRDFPCLGIRAAWKSKPSWALVAMNDQIINPDLERWYYASAKSHSVEIKGASHAVYESHAPIFRPCV